MDFRQLHSLGGFGRVRPVRYKESLVGFRQRRIPRTDDVTAATPLWKIPVEGREETVPMQVVSVPGGPLVTAMMDYDGATYDSLSR